VKAVREHGVEINGVPYLREIITDGHPTLRKVAKKVRPDELADPLVQQLIDDMFETMYNAPGVGLAAPQVNVSKRIFVVDVDDHDHDDEDEHGPLVFVNPRFTTLDGEVTSVEGCLSVPGMIGDLTRYERVVCSALDRNGKRFEIAGTKLFGRCLQHEMDHLDGVLYIDKAKNIRPAQTAEEKAALAESEGEAPGEAALSA
jgi:peptide deformylase